MFINMNLPLWMIERIVQILGKHEYTGTEEIIQAIKEQIECKD